MYPAHDRYWDIRQNRSVHIASTVGQAQFILSDYLHMADTHPKEWLLLCRFADTIQVVDGERELRQLRRLAEHLKRRVFGSAHGAVDPAVAVAVEKDIILRSAPYYAEGLGHDITPAAKLLNKYEREAPVFTQAERNLVLCYAYFVGDAFATEQLASEIAAHRLTGQGIAAVCAEIEDADLMWSGLEQMEGIEVGTAEPPTFQFSFENCEAPVKSYPRFAFYPGVMPEDAVLLQNGVILRPCPDDMDRWRSSPLKIDQTYIAPRYYVQTGPSRYEMAERVDVAHALEGSLEDGKGHEQLTVMEAATPEQRWAIEDESRAMMQMLLETDLKLYGKASKETLEAIQTQGYVLQDGVLQKAPALPKAEKPSLRERLSAAVREANRQTPGRGHDRSSGER